MRRILTVVAAAAVLVAGLAVATPTAVAKAPQQQVAGALYFEETPTKWSMTSDQKANSYITSLGKVTFDLDFTMAPTSWMTQHGKPARDPDGDRYLGSGSYGITGVITTHDGSTLRLAAAVARSA